MAHGRIIECVKCHREAMNCGHEMCARCYKRTKRGMASRPGAPPMLWEGDRLAELRQLHSLGLTISVIASRMRVTKNTIAGACYRFGFVRRAWDGPTSMDRLAEFHRKVDTLPGARPFKYGMTFDGIPFG